MWHLGGVNFGACERSSTRTSGLACLFWVMCTSFVACLKYSLAAATCENFQSCKRSARTPASSDLEYVCMWRRTLCIVGEEFSLCVNCCSSSDTEAWICPEEHSIVQGFHCSRYLMEFLFTIYLNTISDVSPKIPKNKHKSIVLRHIYRALK